MKPCSFFRAVLAWCVLMSMSATAMAETRVASSEELSRAMKDARPGTAITLAPGIYDARKFNTFRHGTKDRPITIRALQPGTVFIKANSNVAFDVRHAYWIFENLDIEGVCENHSWCEHAFHITGPAVGVVLRGNRMHGYNAMIKANGRFGKSNGKRVRFFPSDVLIEGNVFFNATPRKTNNPVNFINLDGGRRWIVRSNLIVDFAKDWPNGVAFGGFTKAMARDSVFERNLVICELTHRGGIRIGLSFGGGGSPVKIREDPIGGIENLNGVMRNNIVLNCPNDVGIYVNKGAGSRIYNNTLYNTFGIDVRFPESDAEIVNNVITGGVRERDGGTAVLDSNLIAGTATGMWLPGVSRYVQRRLEGQDAKYPNYIDKSDVEYVQSLVRKAVGLVSETWIGTGNNRLEDIFAAPALGDLTLQDGDEIVDRGMPVPDLREDFCGTPRNTPPHDLGAIEYSPGGIPTCNPADMIRRTFSGD